MTPFKDLSIKSKLTWLVMLTSGFALLIAGTAFVAHELLTFRRAMVLELSTLADAIGQTASSSLRLNATNYAAITLASLSAQKQIIAAAFFKGGKIFATFPNDRDPASFPENVTGESHRFGRNSLTVIRPVLDPDNSPLATIYIQSSLEQMYSRLRRDVGIVLGVMLAASIVAWVTSARLQGVISKPILHLSHTARSVSEKKDYAVRAQRESGDEVGLLIDSFKQSLSQFGVGDFPPAKDHTQERTVGRDQRLPGEALAFPNTPEVTLTERHPGPAAQVRWTVLRSRFLN